MRLELLGSTTLLDDAMRLLKQTWARSGEGKVLTSDIAGKITEAARPLMQPTKTFTQEVNQGRLLNSLLYSQSPETVSPQLVDSFAKGARNIPDWYYESLKPEVRFSKTPEELGNSTQRATPTSVTFGQFAHRPGAQTADVALNQYIDPARKPDLILSHAKTTAPHEVLHVGTYAGKDRLKSSPLGEYNDLVADVRGTANLVRSMKPEAVARLKAAGLNQYDISPDELAANIFAAKLAGGEKDVKGLFKYSHEKAMENFSNFLPAWAKKGRDWGDKFRGIALPTTLAGGALGAELATPEESEAGPVEIGGKLFRGTPKVQVPSIRGRSVDDFSAENISNIVYSLSGRPAYRTIDNPLGAAMFTKDYSGDTSRPGTVFNAEMNIKNLFDPRYDPYAAFDVARKAADIEGYAGGFDANSRARTHVRNLLTGNWDAYELEAMQKALKESGYTGNWQLEPTHYQKSDVPETRILVPRKYQDVYSTFDKDELKIKAPFATGDEVVREIKNAWSLPTDQAREAVKELVSPDYTYNGEALKFFHPDFKDMVKEFRPDAHFLDPNFEQAHLFPPSKEGFSLRGIREKEFPLHGSDTIKSLPSHSSAPGYTGTNPAVKNLTKSSIFKAFSKGDYTLHENEAMHTIAYEGGNVKIPGSIYDKVKSSLVATTDIEPADIKDSDVVKVFLEASGSLKPKTPDTALDLDGLPANYGVTLVNPGDATSGNMPKFALSNDFKAFITGNYKLSPDEVMHSFTHSGKILEVPDILLSKVEKELAKNLGVSIGDITYPDIGQALADAKLFYQPKTTSEIYNVPAKSKFDKTVYDVENEMDPTKLEYHLPLYSEGTFDAFKAMYLGTEPTTHAGMSIKAGIDKIGGTNDPEKVLLSNFLHSGTIPEWFSPNEKSHGKLLDVAIDLYNKEEVPEDVKEQVIGMTKVLAAEMTDYGNIYKELKSQFGDNYSDKEFNKLAHNKLAIKNLSSDEVIKEYMAPLGGKYGIEVEDLEKYHPEVAKAFDSAYNHPDFVHGDATLEQAAKKIFNEEILPGSEKTLLDELNKAVVSKSISAPFGSITAAQDYAVKYGPKTISHLKTLLTLAPEHGKAEYNAKLAKVEETHSNVVKLLKEHGYLNPEKDIPGYTEKSKVKPEITIKLVNEVLGETKDVVSIDEAKYFALKQGPAFIQTLLKYGATEKIGELGEKIDAVKALLVSGGHLDKKDLVSPFESNVVKPLSSSNPISKMKKAAIAAAAAGTGLVASHAEAAVEDDKKRGMAELGKVNKAKNLDPAVNEFFSGVAERVSHPIEALKKGEVTKEDHSKLVLAPTGINKVLSRTRKIPEVVGKFVGELADIQYKGFKSAGRLAVNKKDVSGEDIENVLRAAQLFFTPVTKALGAATGVGHDLLFPTEVSSTSDFTPARR